MSPFNVSHLTDLWIGCIYVEGASFVGEIAHTLSPFPSLWQPKQYYFMLIFIDVAAAAPFCTLIYGNEKIWSTTSDGHSSQMALCKSIAIWPHLGYFQNTFFVFTSGDEELRRRDEAYYQFISGLYVTGSVTDGIKAGDNTVLFCQFSKYFLSLVFLFIFVFLKVFFIETLSDDESRNSSCLARIHTAVKISPRLVFWYRSSCGKVKRNESNCASKIRPFQTELKYVYRPPYFRWSVLLPPNNSLNLILPPL